MDNLNVFGIAPTGPFVEGFLRFSYEEDAATKRSEQRPEFEILSHVHDGVPMAGEVPKMVTHPIAQQLTAVDSEAGGRRLLHEVPIRFLGQSPQANLRARYEAFDLESGRMVCSGNGSLAARMTSEMNEPASTPCCGPERCTFAATENVSCKFRARMDVQIEGAPDPLAIFQFQSGGINSYRALAAKLKMLYALYGDLRGLPLRLTSWSKSSRLSNYAVFHCANIDFRYGITMKVAGEQAQAFREQFNMDGIEEVLLGLARESTFALDDTESLVHRKVSTEELRRVRPRTHAAVVPAAASTLTSVMTGALDRIRQSASAPAAETATVQPPEVGQEGGQAAADANKPAIVFREGGLRIEASGPAVDPMTTPDVTVLDTAAQPIDPLPEGRDHIVFL
jgi:hypothetical protein